MTLDQFIYTYYPYLLVAGITLFAFTGWAITEITWREANDQFEREKR